MEITGERWGAVNLADALEYDVAGAIDYDALVNIYYTLPSRYRNQPVWLGNERLFEPVRKLVDTAGHPLWRASLDAESPDRLLGRPVLTHENLLPDVLLWGDFKKWVKCTGITG